MEAFHLQPKKSKIWHWILLTFVLAGFTGFLFRLGFLETINFGLSLANIRQAHSHLMFFGWAGLFPLYFILQLLESSRGKAAGSGLMRSSLWVILAFALLSYPSFMLWGYQLVEMGDATLPVSAMLSSGVMAGWYLFMGGYIRWRRHNQSGENFIWFDGALIMLFVSSLGAWAVGAVQMFHIGPEFLEKLLPHFFLTTYTEGWILLCLIGIIIETTGINQGRFRLPAKTLVFLICIGAPMSFPYGMPGLLENPWQSLFARTGSLMISLSVFTFIAALLKNKKVMKSLWFWPVLFLSVKTGMQLVATFLPYGNLLADPGTKILYLHMLFLGAYTTAAAIIISGQVEKADFFLKAIIFSVILVLLSLVLVTWFWPLALTGAWVFDVLAAAAILPVAAMAALWLKLETQS